MAKKASKAVEEVEQSPMDAMPAEPMGAMMESPAEPMPNEPAVEVAEIEVPTKEQAKMVEEYELFLKNTLDWTGKEIERCNDYIFASHNTDQRFIVYRQELYEYRYNVRRMRSHPYFPDISRIGYPKIPYQVPDL